MKPLAAVLLAVGVVALAGSAPAQDTPGKDYPNKIVGKWVTKKKTADLPEGTRFEFSNEGKLTVRVKVDANFATLEGRYKLDGEKLIVMFKNGDTDVKETAKILQLDGTTLKIEDKEMKVEELTREPGK